jgi:lysine 2,3-aminomutase
VKTTGEGCYSVSDYRGGEHSYPPAG